MRHDKSCRQMVFKRIFAFDLRDEKCTQTYSSNVCRLNCCVVEAIRLPIWTSASFAPARTFVVGSNRVGLVLMGALEVEDVVLKMDDVLGEDVEESTL